MKRVAAKLLFVELVSAKMLYYAAPGRICFEVRMYVVKTNY